MNPVRLSQYNNSWFKPGKSLPVQMAWFFFGSPIVRSSWMPVSGIRVAILRLFGAKIAGGVVTKTGLHVKFPWRLEIGADSWIGEDVWLDNLAQVKIGSNCCVSQAVYFCTGNHNWSDPAFGLITRSIELRDGAWAGARATLAPGVTLREGAVAAAGSVVFRDIPAWEIHAGNPASFLKKRVVRASSNADSSSQLSPLEATASADDLETAGAAL